MSNALERERRPRRREMLAAWTPRLVIAPAAAGEPRLCLRLHAVDALYLAVQQHDAADLQLRRPQALFRSLVEPALAHRLRQSLLLQRVLCRAGPCRRPRPRDRDRPAGARRGHLADDLPLSARDLVRGHRRGVELALQPRRRHRIFRAQPGLARFHLPPDHEPQHRDLCDHRDRHLAVFGLRDGPVSRRPALGRSRPRQGGANRRRERRRASIAR